MDKLDHIMKQNSEIIRGLNLILNYVKPKELPNDCKKEENFDNKMKGITARAFCKKCDGIGCKTCKETGLNKQTREKVMKHLQKKGG